MGGILDKISDAIKEFLMGLIESNLTNMDSNEPFRFSFDMTARTGLSSKDFIAPTSFDFREGKVFKMGRTIGAVSFLQILAPELNDRMLADFLDMICVISCCRKPIRAFRRPMSSQ